MHIWRVCFCRPAAGSASVRQNKALRRKHKPCGEVKGSMELKLNAGLCYYRPERCDSATEVRGHRRAVQPVLLQWFPTFFRVIPEIKPVSTCDPLILAYFTDCRGQFKQKVIRASCFFLVFFIFRVINPQLSRFHEWTTFAHFYRYCRAAKIVHQ